MSCRASSFALLLSIGCHAGHGAPDSAAPSAAPLEPGEPRLADFLALDAELDATYPLRATIRRAGALFVEREGGAVNDPSNRNVR